MEKTILVVDDETPIVDMLRFNLQKAGYKVIAAYDGMAALDLAVAKKPDLILLDVMLPKMDGFEACRKIRETSDVPILMLTAREEEIDKVFGLESGADDYITKPFSVRELMARIKANLRRGSGEGGDDSVITIDTLEINSSLYEVKKDGVNIELTLREFELLKFLATQPGHTFTREQLLQKVWGYDYFGDVRTVDVTVRRLREKIEDNPAAPERIMTRRGVGYYYSK